MSLLHEFVLVTTDFNENTIDSEFCMKIMKNNEDPTYTIIEHISIEDAVFNFLWFTFQWIPSINPDYSNDNRYTQGLFRHGITLLYDKSKIALETNCKCWLQLIQVAPDTISLCDNYVDSFEKTPLQSFLTHLLAFSQKLDERNVFIIHFGI